VTSVKFHLLIGGVVVGDPNTTIFDCDKSPLFEKQRCAKFTIAQFHKLREDNRGGVNRVTNSVSTKCVKRQTDLSEHNKSSVLFNIFGQFL